MPTTIKADVHRYSVELHDLAVILLHDPKYPLQASLFLYLLALTDKLRRGQIARILGTHPMNSDAVGKLFRVNGSTVRRHFKHMIDVDLLRYSETTSEAKDGRPPVKRRHYTVMTGKLRQASTALSKDIAKSNKIGVMARRMNVDPPERLAVTDNGLMWISASVHVCTEGETEAQRACTHAFM